MIYKLFELQFYVKSNAIITTGYGALKRPDNVPDKTLQKSKFCGNSHPQFNISKNF